MWNLDLVYALLRHTQLLSVLFWVIPQWQINSNATDESSCQGQVGIPFYKFVYGIYARLLQVLCARCFSERLWCANILPCRYSVICLRVTHRTSNFDRAVNLQLRSCQVDQRSPGSQVYACIFCTFDTLFARRQYSLSKRTSTRSIPKICITQLLAPDYWCAGRATRGAQLSTHPSTFRQACWAGWSLHPIERMSVERRFEFVQKLLILSDVISEWLTCHLPRSKSQVSVKHLMPNPHWHFTPIPRVKLFSRRSWWLKSTRR